MEYNFTGADFAMSLPFLLAVIFLLPFFVIFVKKIIFNSLFRRL